MLHPIGDAPRLPAVISLLARTATRLSPLTFLQQRPSPRALPSNALLI